MNYIGSKQTLLPFLKQVLLRVASRDDLEPSLTVGLLTRPVFCDLFAGTGAVGRFFKRQGFRIIANDIQYYSYALNKAYIEINHRPRFLKVGQSYPGADALTLLNQLAGTRGFISRHYAPNGANAGRLYYTRENAEKADAIRQAIEDWREAGLLSEREYFYLLCSLLEAIDQVANTASVYGAFLKRFKATALKPLELRRLELSNHVRGCKVFREDANELIERIECDFLYLDPPYNHRQYGANYHVLETVASYDSPRLRGITGMRDYSRSRYCVSSVAADALAELISKARARHILLSYNDEGVISLGEIKRILGTRGKVSTFRKTYQRFKADSNRTYKRETTTEYLHYVRVRS